jgi:hypothetical protein
MNTFWKALIFAIIALGLGVGFAFGFWMQVAFPPNPLWKAAWNAVWIGSIVWTILLAFLFRKTGRTGLWAAAALGSFWAAEIVGDFAPNLLNLGEHSLTAYRYTEDSEMVWWLRLFRNFSAMWMVWFLAGLVFVWFSAMPGVIKRAVSQRLAR